jgi:hypothetical protein
MNETKRATLCWAMLGVSMMGCTLDATEQAGREAEAEELSEAPQELKRNPLSEQQQAIVLKLIDDICGDTWCEGDHNFSFDRLDCQKGCNGQDGSCQLSFRLFSHDTDVDTGPTFARSCKTRGFSGFASLVRAQGTLQSLQPAFYDALTDCISGVEAALPR